MTRKIFIPMLILGAIVALSLAFRHYQSVGQMKTATVGKAIVTNVLVPSLKPVEIEGEALFNAKCASCHGKNAAGQEGAAPPLVHMIYEPNHHPDQSFQIAAQYGVRQHHWPFGNMPPVEGITENEVRKIVGYVRTLQKANGIH